MHSPDPRLSCLVILRHAALLLTLCGVLAACDRHSDAEVPQSYGHGSSHQKSYSDHQIDSRMHSASFSDTRGINAHESSEVSTATPTPSVAPAASSATPAATASKFFQ